MNTAQKSQVTLHDELVSRVAALEGKKHRIDSNREALRSTVGALAECTDVDPSTITSIADQLAVQPRFLSDDRSPETLQLERHTKIAKYCAILVVTLFTFSMVKWFHVNNNIKAVLHEVSQIQSRTADFHLRTGRYPYSFEDIRFDGDLSGFETVAKIQMGPQGQLLIDSSGLISSQIMLSPVETMYGQTKWSCSTNASWIFRMNSWLCQYQSSLHFSHQ